MKLDFLQIGFQKCGSTFLEKNVYSANPLVSCLQAANNPLLEQLLLEELILADGFEYDEVFFRQAFFKIVEKLFGECTTNGIIYEPFTFVYERRFDRRVIIDRLNSILPDIKMIMFIRNQPSWLLSHYSQYLKSGGLLVLRDFIECQLNNRNLDAHYIDWFPIVSYLYESFGRENVLICLYEDLAKSPERIAELIFSFIGVQNAQIDPSRVNPSLSQYGLSLRRLLNFLIRFDCGASSYSFRAGNIEGFPCTFTKMRHKFIYRYYKPITNRLLYSLDNLCGIKKRVTLSELQMGRITEKYGKNNGKLAKLMELDLKAYGYPILPS
jgi:hypothetical protein